MTTVSVLNPSYLRIWSIFYVNFLLSFRERESSCLFFLRIIWSTINNTTFIHHSLFSTIISLVSFSTSLLFTHTHGYYFFSAFSPRPSALWTRPHLPFYGPRLKLLFRGPHVSKFCFHSPEWSKSLFHGPVGRKTFLVFLYSQSFKLFNWRKIKYVINHMIKCDVF